MATGKATKPTGASRSASGKRGILKKLGIAALVMVLLGAVGAVAVYNLVDIPNPNASFEAQTTNVYYRNGKVKLGRFAEQNRESIPLREMPQSMQDAAIAAEDRTFWTNQGIDIKGILRAALSNAQGNSTQGASTITQQYVKILYLSSEQTLTRKLREAIVSLKLQNQKSKQQILEGYLNTIYFGRGAYGVQAAAQAYFDKDAKRLTVPESAVLASILNSPGSYEPTEKDDKRRLLERYRYVLNGMVQMGTLEATRRDRMSRRLPHFPKMKTSQIYGGQRGFMLEMIRGELHDLGYDDATIDGGGLKVVSTFSKSSMAAMRRGIKQERPAGPYKQLNIGAASIDVRTGALRALYGGHDYLESPYNWALYGGQPGSTFKAFTLAAALKAGFSLKDTFEGNSPYEFPDGTRIRNEGTGSDGLGTDYGSAISMLTATEESVNTAFVDMTEGLKHGGKDVNDMARKLGIPKSVHLENNPVATLGPNTVGVIDMVNAYSTIANRGVEHPWYVVRKVVRASDGKVLYTKKPAKDEERAVSRNIADDDSYALQQVVKHGTGTAALALGRPAAGKTGTATNGKDQVSSAWFIGYTPQVATGVMYVRGKGQEQLDGWLPEYFGGSYPARTWTAIMKSIMAGMPVLDFPPPVFMDGNAPAPGHAPQPTYTPSSEPAPTQTSSPSPTYQPPAPSKTAAPSPTKQPAPPPSSAPPSPTQISPSVLPSSSPPGNGNGNGNGNGTPPPQALG